MLRTVLAFALAALSLLATPHADARKTVCTITVNSQDEREAFRRHLPDEDYRFVELVERGRPDWLASACRQQVKCDVLVISGHFNGKHFFSDQLAVTEHLPVAEMERAACSDSCPGLFSQLKEVYLFGCDSLNPHRIESVSREIVQTLVNGGLSRTEAERTAQALVDRHVESNRDVMRRVFVGAPSIYGFSSVAPLGVTAGPILDRYLRNAPPGDIGSGRAKPRLLSQFAQHGLTVVPGLRANEPRAAHREEVCRFMDDRRSPADRLAFVHELLKRDAAQVRMFFDRIEDALANADAQTVGSPAYQAALAAIAEDHGARDRFLGYARATPVASTRVRMTDAAATLGWLSPDEHLAETVRIIEDIVSPRRDVSLADVDTLCTLNAEDRYRDDLPRLLPRAGTTIGHDAALACLGSDPHRTRMLHALASANEREVETAEVYFHHRPIATADEVRTVVSAIAQLARPDAQGRALTALARQRLPESDAFEELARLYASATSPAIQRTIASIFLRSDHRALATPSLVQVLRAHRRGPAGDDIIEALIRRLERAVATSTAHASG